MRSKKLSRGFTLIELLVVTGIIVVLTGIVMNSQNSFNKSILLANTAYDIALTIRSAETYGISSRVFGGVSNAGYGIHIDNSITPITSFTLFADINGTGCYPTPPGGASAPDAKRGNCTYSSSDITDKTYSIGNRAFIENFCKYDFSTASWACMHDTPSVLSRLDIVFVRPNPDPMINGTRNAMACITIVHPSGGLRSIFVSPSGVISVTSAPCI